MRLKTVGRQMSLAAGVRTARLRMTPQFIVAGGQRCGTTSLFRALLAHPAIVGPVFHKGVNYFDVNYERGPDWYYAHFPLRSTASRRVQRAGEPVVTFDSSGYYMFHPHAATRIAADLPDVKVVFMLRDPVERAFSAYKHEFARGFETESLEDALRLEDERVEPELARMLADPTYNSVVHRHQAYRRRGLYADQIAPYVDLLGRDQVHVVDSSRFFTEPEQEYARLIAFLGLRPFRPSSFEVWNARPSAALDGDIARGLRDGFAPHDEMLADLLGQPVSWRS